jgi:ferritin-like metal-binding protein YciE
MSGKTFEDFFLHSLKIMLFTEQQVQDILPLLSRSAQAPALRHALDTHMSETRGQIARLESVFDLLDEKPVNIASPAASGLIAEARAMIDQFRDSETLENALIMALQSLKHFEIARYSALSALADQLGLEDIAEILEESLEEEQDMDELLSDLADEAVEEDGDFGEESEDDDEEDGEEKLDKGRKIS